VSLLDALPTLDPAALRARVQRRSYWRLRYTDGRVVNEWDLDWSLAPFQGRQSLRLYCPNGQVAELGNSQDATGRLFQFKGATATAGIGRTLDFHLIGLITGSDGACDCAVWEYASSRLVTFRDNVHHLAYGQRGPLNADVLGIRPD
jgi:hypothetical protein